MWYIRDWWFRRRHGHLDFKIENFTNAYQSECLEAVKSDIARKTSKLEYYWTRVKQKPPKLEMYKYWVDLLGHRHRVEKPFFTEQEIQKYKIYRTAYFAFMTILVLFETVFFSFFGGLMIPKELRSGLLYLIVGFALALTFAFSLHFSLQAVFKWINARALINKYMQKGLPKGVSKLDLTPFTPKFVLGILGCILFVVVNVAVGFVRAYLIDPASSMPEGPLKAAIDLPWHLFAVLFPLVLAIIMAIAEFELSDIRERLRSYFSFKRQFKQLKEYENALDEMLGEVLDAQNGRDHLEKYWQVILDVQRIFGARVDESRKEMLASLERDMGSFDVLGTLNNQVYQKYAPVASARKELFRFPISNDVYLRDLREKLTDILAQTSEIREDYQNFADEHFIESDEEVTREASDGNSSDLEAVEEAKLR